MKNEYLASLAKVVGVKQEADNTSTFRVQFIDKEVSRSFQYRPGQFMEISLCGVGEAPFSITSSPHQRGFLDFTIRRAGRVTTGILRLKKGSTLYLRGPYGNSFPFEEVKARDLVFVAGGIGLAPLRSVINAVFKDRKDFGKIKILCGAKSPSEFCFKDELAAWRKEDNTEVFLTVDEPDDVWRDHVGVVTTLWDVTDMTANGGAAFV